jgi:hypothetical protein
LRTAAGFERHPGAAAQEIGYSQSKRLTSELSRRRHIDRLGGRIGIDGLRIGSRRAHPIATIALRGAGHIAIEARDPGDDDFVAIGLEHAIAQATAEREGRDTERGEQNAERPDPIRIRRRTDLALPDNVRCYFLTGTQHGPSAFPPPTTTGQLAQNPLEYG